MKFLPLALLALASCASKPAYFKMYASKDGHLFDRAEEGTLESCRIDLRDGEIVVKAWGSGNGWMFQAESKTDAKHVRELVGKTLPARIYVDQGGTRWAAVDGELTIHGVDGRLATGSAKCIKDRTNIQADFEALSD